MTLQRLRSDLHTWAKLSPRSVIVLDEAGLSGWRKWPASLNLPNGRIAVVLSGDTGQHASVTRGDALRILEQYSGYRFEELTTIRRQKPKVFRQVVELAAAKQTTRRLPNCSNLAQSRRWRPMTGSSIKKPRCLYSCTKRGKSALLVSPTWAEIDAVTEKVRDTLRTRGVLGQREETVTCLIRYHGRKRRGKREPIRTGPASAFCSPDQALRPGRYCGSGGAVETVCVFAARPGGSGFCPASAAAP